MFLYIINESHKFKRKFTQCRKKSFKFINCLQSTENVVILVLLVILVVFVVYHARQNNEGFAAFFKNRKKPQNQKLLNSKEKNKNVNVVEGIDYNKDKDLAKEFRVRAYPTVYLVRGEEN